VTEHAAIAEYGNAATPGVRTGDEIAGECRRGHHRARRHHADLNCRQEFCAAQPMPLLHPALLQQRHHGKAAAEGKVTVKIAA
jgi:hypothetical protein